MIRALLLLFSLCLGAQDATSPSPKQKSVKDSKAEEVTITSHSVDFFTQPQKHQAVFEKNVVVKRGSLTMKADKITCFLNATNEVQLIIAEGKVIISDQDTVATAGKAAYSPKQKKFILLKKPTILKESSLIEARRITLYHETQEIFFDEPVINTDIEAVKK
jgi:lipopolysaccharide transport protein LptA